MFETGKGLREQNIELPTEADTIEIENDVVIVVMSKYFDQVFKQDATDPVRDVD